MDGRDLKVVAVRTHVVDRVALFEERHAPLILVRMIDACALAVAQLARVRDHVLKADVPAHVLEVTVV